MFDGPRPAACITSTAAIRSWACDRVVNAVTTQGAGWLSAGSNFEMPCLSFARCGKSDRCTNRPVRHAARSCSGRSARSPRHRSAQANASPRRRIIDHRTHGLITDPQPKCSADFSANLLICLKRMADSAQVGLALRVLIGPS